MSAWICVAVRFSAPVEAALKKIRLKPNPDISTSTLEQWAQARAGLKDGRVLAENLVATSDVPPFTRALMDGYAVRAADTAGASRQSPRVLACVEQIFTGSLPSRAVAAGECSEIATGAPMPEGADAVVMVEETAAHQGRVQIFAAAQPRQNIGRQGADIQTGQTVLTPGARLGLAAGIALALVAMALPRTARLAAAAVLLMAATVLVNLAPPNPYLAATLQVWQQGHFLNFNGLTRVVSAAWAYVAAAYLILLAARRRDAAGRVG